MIKKTLVLGALALCSLGTAMAGGILTNTNQSARFARLMALEASTKADAAYYNPAGTARLGEGFHFTFSNQSAFQKRIINSTFAGYKGNGGSEFKTFEGTASAPVIPSLQGVYRKGKWALSGSLAIVGGGGKATFNNGLSMFEAPMSTLPGTLIKSFPGGLMSADKYTIDQYMTGTNYIFGGQIGGAYKINEMFSVYGGVRLNIVSNKYEGHLRNLQVNMTSPGYPAIGLPAYNGTMQSPETPLAIMLAQLSQIPNPSQEVQAQIAGLNLLKLASTETGARLESKQSGWGIAPILGFHFAYEGLNIGAKYEFRSALDVENKTTRDDTGQFAHGVNTAHDVPAMLAIGASYDVIEALTVNVGYHHFFDKSAGMAKGADGVSKQKHLTGGTNEYLAGVEYRINPMFLVSMGGQITRYGLADKFQSDLSFYVNSYSLGFGGAVNVSKNVQINAGYFFTDYSDYKKTAVTASEPSNTYTRKNKVFTVGVDFSF